MKEMREADAEGLKTFSMPSRERDRRLTRPPERFGSQGGGIRAPSVRSRFQRPRVRLRCPGWHAQT